MRLDKDWAIRGHKFAYPGRKDTMPMARTAMLFDSPMGICPARVKKLQISTNICGEKLKNCGYQFKWSFEEALADWFDDNDMKYLI